MSKTRFIGKPTEWESLVNWIDEFVLATTERCTGNDGEEEYLIDVKGLNRFLVPGEQKFGCLDPISAQECSGFVRNLQQELSALLAFGLDTILWEPERYEQSYARIQSLLKQAVPHFNRLSVEVRAAIEALPKEPAKEIKRPSESAIIAWRLRDILGIKTQSEIANKLSEKGVSASQGQVSR